MNFAIKFAAIACVCIVLIGLAFILIFSMDTTKEVRVPDGLEGLSEKEACKKLDKKHLNCKVKYVYDEEVEEDKVISISPKANSKVKQGNSITLTVSSYEDTIEVEDYKGKNVEAIKAKLEEAGIRVVTTPKKVTEADNIEENSIVSQSVEKGKRLQKNNDVIELVYATLIVVYPDFTDGSYNRDLIQQFCDDNGITCNFKEMEDNKFNAGAIILQSRSVGDEVKSGTTITITIATNSQKNIEKTTTNDKKEEGQG